MIRQGVRPGTKWLVMILSAAIFMVPVSAVAQTRISYHPNKYKTQDDVRLGRQAATEDPADPARDARASAEPGAAVSRAPVESR